MGIWLLLLIVFLSAILVGCIAGTIIGKTQARRMHSGGHGGLFSQKEKLILLAVVFVGIGVVLFGAFYTPSNNAEPDFWDQGDFAVDSTPGGIINGGDMNISFDGEDEALLEDEFVYDGEHEEIIVDRPSDTATATPPPRPTPRGGSGGGVVITERGGVRAIQVR